MSTPTDRPAARPASERPRRASTPASDLAPLLAAAVRSVLTVLVPLVALCIVGWIASVRSTSSLAAVARVGVDLWLLAQGSTVAVVGGSVGIAPLGLTLLVVLSARRAVRMWRREQVAAGREVPFGFALGVFTAGHGVLALLLALVSRSGVAAAGPGSALLGGCLAGGLGALVALWPDRPRGPVLAAAAGRPALTATLALVGAGALVTVAALVHGRDDVLALHRALDPGVLGGGLLTAGQALLLPTFAVWGLAWTSGAGFAVGTGTSVAPGGTSLEVLPTLPVLGALPAPGPTPALAWAAVAVPVLVGAGAWWLHARRGPQVDGLLRRCGVAVLTGAGTGLAVAVLAAFAAGPLGHGRMGQIGPDPLLTGVVVAGEVAAGAVLAVLLGRAWRAWRGTTLVVTLPDTAAAQGQEPRKLLGE
ncbi:DUF6350 family protein [Kineococcus sp. LSe6-4]|uniref:DUF6350 family protein n=1 Tax=Kineococcus halophytocola TaxID=3234027 RepID=A0ABV4H1Y7_9ACTN